MSESRAGDTEQERRVRELAAAARGLSRPERDAFLRNRCGHDAKLLRQVTDLLDTLALDGGAPNGPAAGPAAQDPVAGSEAAWNRVLEQLRSRGPAWQRYQDQGEFARGGMGAIHAVLDSDLRRTLAMKILLEKDEARPGDSDPVSLGRFLEEAQVTSQLDHPGIVPVHELGVDDRSRAYFTMKLVRGENLRSIFRRVHDPKDTEWTQTRALGLLLRVCEAMAYAHSKGVIHRDLKPGNVMVGRFGEAYVMDWGLARVLGQEDRRDIRLRPAAASVRVSSSRQDASVTPDSPLLTMDGDVVGTPAYMAPEQAAGRLDEMGPHSDVYAAGAMLYHLLTGLAPYQEPGERHSPRALLAMVLFGPPQPVGDLRPDVAAELVAICEKAMARRVADRYHDMTELADDLRAFLERRVVRAYATGPIQELRKWVARNRALAATAAAAAVLLATLGAWSNFRIRAERNTALANERRAEREATRLAQERRKVMRVSDVKRLDDLLAAADRLWPAVPERAGALRDWLDRAAELIARRAEHERTLAELRARGAPLPHPAEGELAAARAGLDRAAADFLTAEGAADRLALADALPALEDRAAALAKQIERERAFDFGEDAETLWWHDTLRDLIAGLDALAADDPYSPTVASIRRRLEFAETVRQRSITAQQPLWQAACASIADPNECPRYGGLRIREQLGLVPLGRDPDSGLWEFWHLQTGTRPERGADGRLVIGERSGLVFVLLPGGTFLMGAQTHDPDGPNYDPLAEPTEYNGSGEPVAVELAPFFLSKYEMTQAQWLAFTGTNPSAHRPDTDALLITLLHPVEQVSWDDCRRELDRLGLRLPTESQWEYACRAGTATPWWAGTKRESLLGAVNLADRSAAAWGAVWPEVHDWPELNDGYPYHAPVTAFRPNGFGLHNMTGNVYEWCLDSYSSYDVEPRLGDGARRVGEGIDAIIRGASFDHTSRHARSSRRSSQSRFLCGFNVGCRPARALDAE